MRITNYGVRLLATTLITLSVFRMTGYGDEGNNVESLSPAERQLARSAELIRSKSLRDREAGLLGLRNLITEESHPRNLRRRAHELCASYIRVLPSPSDRKPALDHLQAAIDLTEDTYEIARLSESLASAMLNLESDANGVCEILLPWVQRLDELPRDTQRNILETLTAALIKLEREEDALQCVTLLLDRNLVKDRDHQVALLARKVVLTDEDARLEPVLAELKNALAEGSDWNLVITFRNLVPVERHLLDRGRAADMVGLLKVMLETMVGSRGADPVILRNKMADLIERSLNDPRSARSLLEENLSFLPEASEDSSLRRVLHQSLCNLIRLQLISDGKNINGLKRNLLAVSSSDASLMQTSYDSLLAGPMSESDVTGLADEIYRIIAAEIENAPLVLAAQEALVRVLMKRRETSDEALREAVILFRLTEPSSADSAAELVSAAFKACDLNLARANQFLRFLCFGAAGEDGLPGNDDDIANPLREIPVPANPERNALYENLVMGGRPERVFDYSAMARVHVLMGRPEEAFDCLIDEFRDCPPAQSEVQAAAEKLSALVLSHTFDADLAEQLMSYLNYGIEDKDQGEDTSDKNKLPDMFEQIRSRLRAVASDRL